MAEIPHERDLKDIRKHLREMHGVTAYGTVRLATFLRHRRLHKEGVVTVPHTHREERP